MLHHRDGGNYRPGSHIIIIICVWLIKRTLGASASVSVGPFLVYPVDGYTQTKNYRFWFSGVTTKPSQSVWRRIHLMASLRIGTRCGGGVREAQKLATVRISGALKLLFNYDRGAFLPASRPAGPGKREFCSA